MYRAFSVVFPYCFTHLQALGKVSNSTRPLPLPFPSPLPLPSYPLPFLSYSSPSLFFPSPSPIFAPFTSFPLSLAVSPLPQHLRGLGKRCKLPQWGQSSSRKGFGAYLSRKKQLWWQQFCGFLYICCYRCSTRPFSISTRVETKKLFPRPRALPFAKKKYFYCSHFESSLAIKIVRICRVRCVVYG